MKRRKSDSTQIWIAFSAFIIQNKQYKNLLNTFEVMHFLCTFILVYIMYALAVVPCTVYILYKKVMLLLRLRLDYEVCNDFMYSICCYMKVYVQIIFFV
jgi:hypothetical protein